MSWLHPETEVPDPILVPYQEPQPVKPHHPIRDAGRRVWGAIVAAGAFLAKFGAIVWKLKILTVALSMIVSIGFYAWWGGWWFGVGLVALIFVHEMGHVLALKRQGVPASAPIFIPFVGAMIGMKRMPENAWREAEVGLAGPVLGSIGAAVVWAAGGYYHSNFLTALAFVGFLINLFNLLPIIPLDGGRAAAALHPAIWFVGLLGLIVLTVFWPSPIMPLIIIIGGLELWQRWKARHVAGFGAYYKIEPWQRAVVAATYFGLAVGLVLAMHATHVPNHLV